MQLSNLLNPGVISDAAPIHINKPLLRIFDDHEHVYEDLECPCHPYRYAQIGPDDYLIVHNRYALVDSLTSCSPNSE